MNTESHGWIGVDLDGTLAFYPSNFPDIGPPIPRMQERVKQWLAEGKQVKIFTARVAVVEISNDDGQAADQQFAEYQQALIELWCQKHLGQVLPVTAQKDFLMVELWDDRCVQMVTNTGIPYQDVVAGIEEKT